MAPPHQHVCRDSRFSAADPWDSIMSPSLRQRVQFVLPNDTPYLSQLLSVFKSLSEVHSSGDRKA